MIGETVSNYKVIAKLGEGGMGVVYKAVDTRLDRFLALKFLSSRTPATASRKRHFMQEAKSASALNHPNIVNIYDIGDWQGADFIAMEFVEGNTLQHLLASGPLPQSDVLTYASQIADALSAAHHAGIVHRDLKPANVMITLRGMAKILDFGVAKLTSGPVPVEPEAPPTDFSLTSTLVVDSLSAPGTIAGSLSYMSPEQTRGETVDARSDIFSLGIVLYEALTGKPPFRGTKAQEVLSAIRSKEPEPLPSSISGPVIEIVSRCLRKNPDRRFQTMNEVKSAIDILRMTSTSQVFTPAPERLRPHARKLIWIAAGLAGVAVLGSAWMMGRRAPVRGLPHPARLTSDAGLNLDPAVSPDGKLLAYASDRSGEANLDIWVQQMGGGDPIRVTHFDSDESEPSFTPDGTHVVFRSEREGGGIYVVGALGGEPRKIADLGRRPQVSPDGKTVVYWTGPASPFPLADRESRIYTVSIEGGEPRPFAVDFPAAVQPVWSAAGDAILFFGTRASRELYGWWVAPLKPGREPVFALSRDPVFCVPYAWAGEQVYCTASGTEGHTIRTAHLSPKTWKVDGGLTHVLQGTSSEDTPAVSANGLLVFASMRRSRRIYELPLDTGAGSGAGEPKALTRTLSFDYVNSVSADGSRMVYLSQRQNPRTELWAANLASGKFHKLGETTDPVQISPDGSQVAFQEYSDDVAYQVFLMPFEGGPSRKICERCGSLAGWTPDGRYLIYRDPQLKEGMFLLEAATGVTRPYMKDPHFGLSPRDISADGRWFTFEVHRPGAPEKYLAPFRIERAPAVAEWIPISKSPLDGNPRLGREGNRLYLISERDGFRCLWTQSLDKVTKRPIGPATVVQHFHLPALRISPKAPGTVVSKGKILLNLEDRQSSVWTAQLAP